MSDIIRKIADIVELVGDDTSKESTPGTNLNPVMVPPLQQHIELAKAEQGKESPVIAKLTHNNDDVGKEPSDDDNTLALIKQMIGR